MYGQHSSDWNDFFFSFNFSEFCHSPRCICFIYLFGMNDFFVFQNNDDNDTSNDKANNCDFLLNREDRMNRESNNGNNNNFKLHYGNAMNDNENNALNGNMNRWVNSFNG